MLDFYENRGGKGKGKWRPFTPVHKRNIAKRTEARFFKGFIFYCDLVLFKVFLKVLCATYVYIDDERISNIAMLANPGVNNVFLIHILCCLC